MKRFRAFVLAMLILFMCTACKKETLPATQPGSAQTAAGEAAQTVSGVPSVFQQCSTGWPARSWKG